MRRVIIDASPLIFLAKGELLNETSRLAKEFHITPYVKRELERPREYGIEPPELKSINSFKQLRITGLTAKEMQQANKLREKYSIGLGEAESAILWKRGGFDIVIVADEKAEKVLRNKLNVNIMDIIDIGFELSKKGINPLRFAVKLWEKAHYRTYRLQQLLRRHR